MTDPNSLGSPYFEGKGSGGGRRAFTNQASPNSRGGISISTQKEGIGRLSPRPMGSRGDRISEYVPVMPSAVSPRGVRYHVDSLLLRGRTVARALEEADESDEVASKFQGKSVMVDADYGGMAELPYEGFVVDHGLKEGKAAIPKDAGEGPSMMRKGDEVKTVGDEPCTGKGEDFLPLKVDNNSAESAAPVGITGPNEEADKLRASTLDAVKLATILGQIIPGIGPVAEASKRVEPDLKEVRSNGIYTGKGLRIKDPMGKLDADHSSAAQPYVFGAKTPGKQTLGRKWKKAARISDRYSFDFLAQASNIKEGRKRSKGIVLMDVDDAGIQKRSREEEHLIGDIEI
ncbi:hypothetical protein COLO4_20097 [Corchorus olitorius]|uniref:Uncharacterized protein n=1 Tax=Corchorus olitorius TaxID=93759 RepID=A0A1R3J1M5_9ROSI|nr:hypothetical protein COLO4_20097 [Corchorus olitorius]